MNSQTRTSTTTTAVGQLKLRGAVPANTPFPDLDRDGYCVVKSVIPAAKAAEYTDRMYKWLESFGRGFQYADQSTWHVANLPDFNRGGLFNRHGCGQEQFAWDLRSEPALIDVFAKIWGTDELLVSPDAINISLPFPKEEAGERSEPWPHVDQSPNRRHKHCIQGLVNMLPNGDKDGGLRVLQGSFALYTDFFEAHEHEKPADGWTWNDSYGFNEKHMQWFYARGCTWEKVNADPGDVILWDSRCVHYGASPEGDKPRVAIYCCYKPAADITPEFVEKRRIMMDELAMTSHDPLLFRWVGVKGYGAVEENEQVAPKVRPVLSERGKQLAGIVAY